MKMIVFAVGTVARCRRDQRALGFMWFTETSNGRVRYYMLSDNHLTTPTLTFRVQVTGTAMHASCTFKNITYL